MNTLVLGGPAPTGDGGLDGLGDIFGMSQTPSHVPPQELAGPAPTGDGGLDDFGDIFGMSQTPSYVPPQEVWLPASKGKGLEITGTFMRKNKQIIMNLIFANKAMQAMGGFAIQFNRNSFGLIPVNQLQIRSPLPPNQNSSSSLVLNTTGLIQKMEPLTNLQVAVKNNTDVFYFSAVVPIHVFFEEDGEMEQQVFMATWKDIPAQNEVQYTINNVEYNADTVSTKLKNNNIFTVAKQNVEGQDMLYQSLKLTNGIWVLAELKIQPTNTNFVVTLRSGTPDIFPEIFQILDTILHN